MAATVRKKRRGVPGERDDDARGRMLESTTWHSNRFPTDEDATTT